VALMPVDEALTRVLADATPLPAETVLVAAAHGRVLAEDVAALRTQPPAPVSSMDGYALRAADVAVTPARLRVIGEIPAGRAFAGEVGPGQAVRIFTGGILPDGADTIVIQENTERDAHIVVVEQGAAAGRFIRRAGLDFTEGDVRLAKGRLLTVRDVGLAAAMNHAVVRVHRRPRVAVISTGSELVPPGLVADVAQVVSSNGPALAAFAAAHGAEAVDFGIVADRLDDTVAAIRRVRQWGADLLITSGGASVGDYDLVQTALGHEGMDLAFWKIAMRPGKPMMSGRLGDMQVLGLPGNPVSAYVCSLLFMTPLLWRLGGLSGAPYQIENASLGRDLPANDERQDYLRAAIEVQDGVRVAIPFDVQDSSMMSALGRADCLVVRAPHAPPAKRGEACEIVKLSD
jgi:molybdopterin molybdotransferase